MDSGRRHVPVANQRRMDFAVTTKFSPQAILFFPPVEAQAKHRIRNGCTIPTVFELKKRILGTMRFLHRCRSALLRFLKSPRVLIYLLIAVFAVPAFFEAAQAEDIANNCASVHNDAAADPPRAGENGYGTPVCLYCPQPGFSEEAIKAKHFDAIVVLEALVTAEGRATNVHVLKAVGLGLDIKALEIIPTWRFKPALGPDGRAASVVTRIECKFHSDSTASVMPR
jgi:TonB family protein